MPPAIEELVPRLRFSGNSTTSRYKVWGISLKLHDLSTEGRAYYPQLTLATLHLRICKEKLMGKIICSC